MFTGIIRHVGRVQGVSPTEAGRRLQVDLGPLTEGLALGDSVAVDGACLSACAIDGSRASFDVVAETLSRTTLGNLAPGARVNLERALRLSDGLDGHLVQGHVDATAKVQRIDRAGGQWKVTFRAEASVVAQMIPKGSIAIAGVSLTLVEADGEHFSVALIPTTLAETTLPDLAVGDEVNIETDLIGKYLRRWLAGREGSAGESQLSLETLRRAGFA
jgi:riboflavin synthase